MQFTNNFNATVVVFIYNSYDPFYFTALRDPKSLAVALLAPNAEMSVAPNSQITFRHPKDSAWLIGVKLDTFWGRLGNFIAPLPNNIFDATFQVELTALGELRWNNPVVAPVPPHTPPDRARAEPPIACCERACRGRRACQHHGYGSR